MTTYDARIARAEHLAANHPAAAAAAQFLRRAGAVSKADVRRTPVKKTKPICARWLCHFPALIKLIARTGTDLLINFAAQNLSAADAQLQLLAAAWEGGEALDPAARFYARVLLQPYAEYLASRGDINASGADPTCPFCNARPVAGVLRGEGDGGKRWLLCSLCSTEWQYRRVLCPGCGEENKDKLPIYTAAEFPAARVDACDTCHTYLKSIDLTKDGHAIPIVDEIATVALNIWAEEHDYVKLETNLLGM